MLNKTNTFETDKSTEKFTQNTFPDKHTINQLNQKSIQFIQDHSIQIFKETLKLQQNFKNNAPIVRNALKTIQDYINRILKKTGQIEQILKNMPNTKNMPDATDTKHDTFLKSCQHIFERFHAQTGETNN